jgi:hypothetical protein
MPRKKTPPSSSPLRSALEQIVDSKLENIATDIQAEVSSALAEILGSRRQQLLGASTTKAPKQGRPAKDPNFVCPRKPHKGPCGRKCREAAASA